MSESAQLLPVSTVDRLKSDYNLVCQIADKYSTEPIESLYHVTTEETFKLIRSEKTLCPNTAKQTRAGEKVIGVWLCASKFKDDLPDISPYGTHRLKFRIEEIFHFSYQFDHLYFLGTHHFGTKVQYVRLLLSESATETEGIRMDLHDNPLLCHIIRPNGSWWVDVCCSYLHPSLPKLYVEVLVKRHLSLSSHHYILDPKDPGALWDTVRPTVKNFRGEISGIQEELKAFVEADRSQQGQTASSTTLDSPIKRLRLDA